MTASRPVSDVDAATRDAFVFYLGSHRPHWLAEAGVPLFVSHMTLKDRKTFPRAVERWALDSGAFSQVARDGKFTDTPRGYADAARRYRDEIGMLDWAAPQDWMCEPFVLRKTHLSVREHQSRTVQSLLDLRSIAPDLPFVPALQGWTEADYLRHVDQYAAAGIDLTAEPVVALGSVCRRQATTGALRIIRALADIGIRLHGLGIKMTALPHIANDMVSADSMAWSYAARYERRSHGCEHRGSCANCLRFALAWRERVLHSARRGTTAGRPMELALGGSGE